MILSVYSQLLQALSCGVVTHLQTSVKDKEYKESNVVSLITQKSPGINLTPEYLPGDIIFN